MTTKSKYQKPYQAFFERELGFNIMSDPAQLGYVDAILDPLSKTQIIFCDSKAGTGKTSIALASAYWLHKEGKINEIIYIRSAVAVRDMGHLPGTLAEKDEPYMEPFYDTLNDIGVRLHIQDLRSELGSELTARSTSHLRGINKSNDAIVIIDEAQNLDLTELQTTLTRFHDNVKIVVIGSTRQVDNKHMQRFGKDRITAFELYMQHFASNEEVGTYIARLTKNYRGKLANHADDIQESIKVINSGDKLIDIQSPRYGYYPNEDPTIINNEYLERSLTSLSL